MIKIFKRKKNNIDAPNWYEDKYQALVVQRNILAVVSITSAIASAMAALAVFYMTPLKSVQPFVIQIDEKSGITQVVDVLTKHRVSENEALDNYFLWKFLRARETYALSDYYYNRDITRLFSSPDVFNAYRGDLDAQNPQSFPARLTANGRRQVSSPTISYISRKSETRRVAQVRFLVTEKSAGSEAEVSQYKIATIEYGYLDIDLSKQERLVNPFGFQVISYRVDDETVRR